MVVLSSCGLWVGWVWKTYRLLHRSSLWWETRSHWVLAIKHSRERFKCPWKGENRLTQNSSWFQPRVRRKEEGRRGKESCWRRCPQEPCCKFNPINSCCRWLKTESTFALIRDANSDRLFLKKTLKQRAHIILETQFSMILRSIGVAVKRLPMTGMSSCSCPHVWLDPTKSNTSEINILF